jgi:uncharacterized damage-inducible protein DinB
MMTNREFFIGQASRELAPFVRLFEALPGDKLDYRPHPQSRSARELVGHLLAEMHGLEELARTKQVRHQAMLPFDSLEDAASSFQEAHQAVIEQVGNLSDADWETGQSAYILSPEHKAEGPVFRIGWMLLNDMIHHRGQLSTYVRPMGGQMPVIYG